MKIIKLAMLLLLAIGVGESSAQIYNPVTWSYAAKRTSSTEAVVFIKAVIDQGWHIYSIKQPDGGPLKTTLTLSKSPQYQTLGNPTEPKPMKLFEKVFDMDVLYFEKQVIFQQKVKLLAANAKINGKVGFMACNDKRCLNPQEIEFSLIVK